jgi:DeoR/GlpR family transcriptional regulator of sugar metabolism
MNPIERRALIYQRLQRDGKIGLNEMADELGVSSMTIRRDLRRFIDQGVATMSVGTAYLTEQGDSPAIPVSSKQQAKGSSHKRAIGRLAAELVKDGDTIIVDCGTTTCELLNYIGGKRLTVITNSIPVAGVVGSNPNIKLIYAPGEYSDDSHGMVGPLAVNFFHTLRVDKAFLGAHGFDAVGGANEPVLGDATAKRAMLEATTSSYLMVDSGKYGNVHLMALSKLSDFSCVITDADFPEERKAELEAACNQVIYAE